MPWIHLDDVTEMMIHGVESEAVSGVWNATSPNPVRNAEFTQELARAVHRPALIPVPPFALKLAFGEFGEHMLDSARVIPAAAARAGFQFQYPELGPALRDLV
jgi:NAD dependent epimerase/dehydratase family enzyme